MVIQLNCLGRAEPADLTSVLPALARITEGIEVPHARLGVMLDWVQYRRNFRDPVAVRRFLSNGHGPYAEIALDVRRVRALDQETLARTVADRLAAAGNGHRLLLEDWVAPSKSVIWAFNRSYWRHLSAWDTTFQKDYTAAVPGGSPTARTPPSGASGSSPSCASCRASTSGPSCPTRSTRSSWASATEPRRASGWTRSRRCARSRATTSSIVCAT